MHIVYVDMYIECEVKRSVVAMLLLRPQNCSFSKDRLRKVQTEGMHFYFIQNQLMHSV
jgi:hypothetical protein